MKKCLKVLIVCVLVMIVSSFLYAGGSSETTSALEKIKKAGKLVVATEAQYAPYEFKDANANIVGCDMFLASQIASSLGVKLEIVDMSFDGIIPAVQSGQVDLGIAAFTNTPERAEVIDFSNIMKRVYSILLLLQRTKKNIQQKNH